MGHLKQNLWVFCFALSLSVMGVGAVVAVSGADTNLFLCVFGLVIVVFGAFALWATVTSDIEKEE